MYLHSCLDKTKRDPNNGIFKTRDSIQIKTNKRISDVSTLL